jgi:hypothetical protein
LATKKSKFQTFRIISKKLKFDAMFAQAELDLAQFFAGKSSTINYRALAESKQIIILFGAIVSNIATICQPCIHSMPALPLQRLLS